MGKKKKEGLNLSPVSTVSEKNPPKIKLPITWRMVQPMLQFSPCCNSAQAENPSPVYKTRLGSSAQAKGLKNLKKSHVHVIKTEFKYGLKSKVGCAQ